MWKEYFGEQARIIGIDLNPEAKRLEHEGFEIFIGSQSDKNFWSSFFNKVVQGGLLCFYIQFSFHLFLQLTPEYF